MILLRFFILLLPLLAKSEPVQARKSQEVVNSLGINTHFQYYSYGHPNNSQIFDNLFSRLLESGIINIRDRTGNDPNIDVTSFHFYSQKLKRLTDAGISISMIGMSPERDIDYSHGLAELQKIELHTLGGTFRNRLFPGGIKIKKILGTNEYDNIFSGAETCPHDTRVIPSGLNWLQRTNFCRGSDWPEQLINYSKGLYQGIKTHPNPLINSIPVHGPPLVHVPLYESVGITNRMRPINQFIDNQTANLYDFLRPAGVRVFDREFPSRLDLFNNKPFDITEFGYYTEKANPADTQWQSVERQAWNTLVSYFDYIEDPNVYSAYIYELLSQEGFPTAVNPMQGSFGILYPNYEPKPVFYSIKNLIKLFKDLDVSFEPGSVDYTLTSANQPPTSEGIKHSLYQKSDGKYLLVLRYLRQDPTNSPVNFFRTINVNFTEEWDVDIVRPYISEFPLASFEETRSVQNIQVPDDILVLVLSKKPPPSPPTPEPTATPTPQPRSNEICNIKATYKKNKNQVILTGLQVGDRIEFFNKKLRLVLTRIALTTNMKLRVPRKIREGLFTVKTKCGSNRFKFRKPTK